MTTLNVTAVLPSSPLVAAPAASPLPATSAEASVAPGGGRDGQIAELANISASVNSLRQAATAQTAGSQSADLSDEPLLELPALPPMPTPQAAPAVPSDDHGQSNIVFADSDADGALIH